MTASRVVVSSHIGGCAKRAWVLRVTAALVTSLVLVGCESLPQTPRDHALSWAYAWAAGTLPEKVDTTPYLPRPKVAVGNGLRTLSLFNKPGGPDKEIRWNEGFRQACARQSGRFDANKLCHSGDDPDKILFAVALKSWYGDGSSSVEITYVEPTRQPPSLDYQLVLQRAGFMPDRIVQQRKIMAAVDAESRQMREEARARSAWQLMRERGRAVCQDRDGVRYFGFVEDFTESRMKVSVTRAYFIRSPAFAPGNFRPEVIWTGPVGWFPCD